GPKLILMLSGCLLVPLLAIAALIVAVRLLIGPRRWVRVVPLVLLLGCIALATAGPDLPVDLHLITCVYLAGGPHALNDWAQELLRNQPADHDAHFLDADDVPVGVRQHLTGFVSVGGTIWSRLPRVRLELGGGFYHYGVVVFPSDAAPPAEWWQQV